MALQMKACNNLQNKRKHLHECFGIPGMTAPLRAWHGTCIIKGGVETRKVVTDEAERFNRQSVDTQK